MRPLQCVVAHGTYKYRHGVSPGGFAYCAALLAVHLAVILWSRGPASTYPRWRELVAAGLRLDAVFNPTARVGFADILSRLHDLEGIGLGRGSLLAVLLFVGDVPRLAIIGFGLPLRVGAHEALQLGLTALAWTKNEAVCTAVLQPPAAEGMQPGAASAAAAVHWWHSAFSFLLSMLPQPFFMPIRLGTLEQCRCLLGWFQICLGFLVPAVVHIVSESQAYRDYYQRGRRGAQQGSSSQPAGWLQSFMHRLYRGVWQLVQGVHCALATWVGLLILAIVWQGVAVALMKPL